MTDTRQKRPVVPDPVRPLDHEIDLPTGRGLVLVQVPRLGWTVLQVTTQGARILSSVVVTGPDPLAVALEQYKIATVRLLATVAP